MSKMWNKLALKDSSSDSDEEFIGRYVRKRIWRRPIYWFMDVSFAAALVKAWTWLNINIFSYWMIFFFAFPMLNTLLLRIEFERINKLGILQDLKLANLDSICIFQEIISGLQPRWVTTNCAILGLVVHSTLLTSLKVVFFILLAGILAGSFFSKVEESSSHDNLWLFMISHELGKTLSIRDIAYYLEVRLGRLTFIALACMMMLSFGFLFIEDFLIRFFLGFFIVLGTLFGVWNSFRVSDRLKFNKEEVRQILDAGILDGNAFEVFCEIEKQKPAV